MDAIAFKSVFDVLRECVTLRKPRSDARRENGKNQQRGNVRNGEPKNSRETHLISGLHRYKKSRGLYPR